jgi:hypothetical protein
MAEKKKEVKKEAKKEEKAVKEVKKAEVKADKKKAAPAKEVLIEEDEYEFEEVAETYLQCAVCGLVVSVADECECEEHDVLCCGKPMKELPESSVGDMYRCAKCGLSVIIEDDCSCAGKCDLVCCGKPMALCDEY